LGGGGWIAIVSGRKTPRKTIEIDDRIIKKVVLSVHERCFFPFRGTINACFSEKLPIKTIDINNKIIKKVVLFVRERYF